MIFELASVDTPTIIVLSLVLIVCYGLGLFVKNETLNAFGGFGIFVIGLMIIFNINTLLGLCVMFSGLIIGFGVD